MNWCRFTVVIKCVNDRVLTSDTDTNNAKGHSEVLACVCLQKKEELPRKRRFKCDNDVWMSNS